MPMLPDSRYETLTAMITPAIFLTANASLIISTSNRMSRVVDRIRVLNDLADRMGRGVTDLDYVNERLEAGVLALRRPRRFDGAREVVLVAGGKVERLTRCFECAHPTPRLARDRGAVQSDDGAAEEIASDLVLEAVESSRQETGRTLLASLRVLLRPLEFFAKCARQ